MMLKGFFSSVDNDSAETACELKTETHTCISCGLQLETSKNFLSVSEIGFSAQDPIGMLSYIMPVEKPLASPPGTAP